jgi:two-component system cell cycle sensor histidine kinase/response regulator CckA
MSGRVRERHPENGQADPNPENPFPFMHLPWPSAHPGEIAGLPTRYGIFILIIDPRMSGKPRNGGMMVRQKPSKLSYIVFGISVLISVVLFIYDWFRPIDIAVWLFYLIPLLFTSYAAPRWAVYLLLSLCTLLIGLGYLVSASQGVAEVALLNRTIGVTVLWLTIVILLERKRVEDDLRESTQRYRDLVELSPETIYIEQEGRIVFVNRAGVELFGGSRVEDLLGKHARDLLHPDSLESIPSWGRRADAATKEMPPVEITVRRLDGTTVEMEVSSVPVHYQGRPALQVFARNIAPRKRLEDQLRQSQKIEAVGRLAGGIAHDFNNLMTVITGYVGLTKKRSGDPELVMKGLEEIGKASSRATRLTQQLVAFGRKQILQPQILDLNLIVSNMERMLRHLIGEDIELVTTLDSGIGKVKADPGQIEQVIVNLALNSRDALPNGGKITIETGNIDLGEPISLEHEEIPVGRYVKLLFRDDGTGMDDETKAHMFEPYFTTKEVGKGVGLGLATVYGIIRQTGGDILVESALGKGTTFTILLPWAAEAEAARDPLELVLDAPPGEETILVVEDEEPVRTLVRETLEDAGYQVFEASDGEEALALLSRTREPIHLLLTDVVMPKIGGRTLASRVSSRHPEMQVLFMTGYFDTDIDRQENPLGRKPVIFKPFSPQELMSKVRELLDG